MRDVSQASAPLIIQRGRVWGGASFDIKGREQFRYVFRTALDAHLPILNRFGQGLLVEQNTGPGLPRQFQCDIRFAFVFRIGLHDTDFAQATCGTIRLKLLKIGALVRISVRRIKIAMASACPAAQDWGRAAMRLAIAAIARASPA